MKDLCFDVDDLEIGELAVTSMRDSVALPESGASGGSSSCSCGSSSCCCCQPHQPNLPA
ncbi:thiazolylpeptide-type bacteriocin [Lentzea sp. NPDC051213]|uniref:thiazolylpeptide-type bacteriocin n=1 Tax=Lentzea sp. NPDC051213 TaxID=3364126 RepID=UPI0037BC8F9E